MNHSIYFFVRRASRAWSLNLWNKNWNWIWKGNEWGEWKRNFVYLDDRSHEKKKKEFLVLSPLFFIFIRDEKFLPLASRRLFSKFSARCPPSLTRSGLLQRISNNLIRSSNAVEHRCRWRRMDDGERKKERWCRGNGVYPESGSITATWWITINRGGWLLDRSAVRVAIIFAGSRLDWGAIFDGIGDYEIIYLFIYI